MGRRLLDRVLTVTRAGAQVVVAVAFTAIVVVVFGQVVSRFVFNAPFSWSEELARYLQVWLIMLGSAACLRRGLHLTVDYAVHGLSQPVRRVLSLLSLTGILFFLIVVFVSGVWLIVTTSAQKTAALQVPIWLVYAALPVGSVLMLLEAVALFLDKLGETGQPTEQRP